MTQTENKKVYDLEERTQLFAKNCRSFTRKIFKDIPNIEDIKQLIRSSGSVAANYIEANEAFSKKDFIHRIKICRKEAKESEMWLKLLDVNKPTLEEERDRLKIESVELRKIFDAILEKSK